MHKKLKELRLKKHYTTLYMAKAIGISKPYYCQIENGRRGLSYENAVKIAAVFNKKPDQIFYDEYEKE